MGKTKTALVQGIEISYHLIENEEFINLTDIAKFKSLNRPAIIVQTWMNTNKTIEFLLAWEKKNNPDFKVSTYTDFKGFEKFAAEMLAGKNPTPSKWMSYTNAKGFKVKKGRYGGIFAHKNIAFHFATWVNAGFYLYVIEEFERLKTEELIRLGDPFDNKRNLTAGNFSLLVSAIIRQTDERLLTHPQPYKSRLPIAAEVDLLNKIVFGNTAKEWRLQNSDKPENRNQRDYASVLELVILNNLEFLDSMLLEWNCEKEEREILLKQAHEFQYPILKKSKTIKRMQQLADKIRQ